MLERERVFTKAGLALVAATSRDEIDDVAVGAALDLVAPGTLRFFAASKAMRSS